MAQLITMGETMVSFTPGASGALRYVPDYRMRVAGAESNLAIGASKLGIDVGWISKLGEDEFGHYILNGIRAEGVDTKGIIFDTNNPTGIMFKETGVGETKVYYYRSGSAASHLVPEDLNEEYFKGAKILHLTGITPVLSETCKETVLKAIEIAEKLGIQISFDPNIRKKLWKDTDFSPLIRDITLRSNIVLLGLDEAKVLFDTEKQEEIFEILFTKGKAELVAIKDGAEGAWVGNKEMTKKLPPFPCKCIEPIGAGDGFNAGFLSGVIKGKDLITCGRMGTIAGALATQTTGDIEGYPSEDQMQRAIDGTNEIYR